MRTSSLLALGCALGCYPSSDLTLPLGEGYLSRILVGSDGERVFAHASESEELAFNAGDDLILEAFLYRETLAELGLGEGPVPVIEQGRPPPTPDSLRRTTITGGEFSGWDEVGETQLSIRIPYFDANACTGCIALDESSEPTCKLDCILDDPQPATPPVTAQPDPIAIPPLCPPEQVAFVGEAQCHTFSECPADGWPEITDAGAWVRFGAGGTGTRDSPFDTITQAIAAGATRIVLSAGTHEFDGLTTVPLELYGACAEQTIVVSVLRMRAELILHDVTVMGGIETCSIAEIRRVHLHGGPLLGERAQISAVDLALHDSHVVLGDSTATFERLYVASDLDSFTCWGSRALVENAFLSDRGGRTLVVGPTCTLGISNAVLLPYDRGAVVEERGTLSLSSVRIEGVEAGILVREGATATITGVRSLGDEGLEVAGSAYVSNSIIESTDEDGGAVLTNFGEIAGARVLLLGAERGITSEGSVVLDDVTIDSGSLGVVVGVDGMVELNRASITARITCIDAIGSFEGDDLLLSECETGLSTAELAEARRIEARGARVGAAVFAGMLTLEEVNFEASVAGIDVENGAARIASFVIENGAAGAELSAGGTLLMEQGRLSRLKTGLVLPPEIRPEQVLDQVTLTDVERVFETR